MVVSLNFILIGVEVCDQQYMMASSGKRDCDLEMAIWDMNVYDKIIVNNKM